MTAEWAPSRHVVLDGAVNVRDIGGYRSSQGLVVARGRLFRADSLSQLTRQDTERLDDLVLRTVIDFRTPGEVLLGGTDRLPYGIEFASLPVSGGDLGAVYELIAHAATMTGSNGELGDERAAELMVDINRGFVADPRQREAFGAALRLLCSPGRLPLLYHCSSGKDRAGWMTAIVLTALGVPRELVWASAARPPPRVTWTAEHGQHQDHQLRRAAVFGPRLAGQLQHQPAQAAGWRVDRDHQRHPAGPVDLR